MAKLKTKMLLQMIDDILIEYPNIYDFIQQKLTEKCDREGISIDEVSLDAKTFLQTKDAKYQSQHMILTRLRESYVLLSET